MNPLTPVTVRRGSSCQFPFDDIFRLKGFRLCATRLQKGHVWCATSVSFSVFEPNIEFKAGGAEPFKARVSPCQCQDSGRAGENKEMM